MKEKEINKYAWSRISGDKYFAICDILEDENLPDLDKQAELIALIEDLDVDTVYELPLPEFADKANRLRFLNVFKPTDYRKLKSIRIGDMKYDVISDFSKLNFGQYVDYQNFITLPLRDSYYKILSIVLIPEGHKYNTDYDILDVHKNIRENLSWQEVQGLLSFFLKAYIRSYNSSLIFIRAQIQKETDPEKKKELETKFEKMISTARHLISSIGCA